MASWFQMLKDGTAAKSKTPASSAISGGTGSTTISGYYSIVDYTGAEGKAVEAFADCPPAWTILGTIGSSGPNAYLLPWGGNKICWSKLQGAHELFFTHAMNGCGVLISGDRASPTVVHANAYDHPSVDNLEGAAKATKRREIYGDFISELQTRRILATTNVATWYPGTDYLGAKSGVFGAKVAGNWIFYGHANRGSQADTKVIWPPDAVTDGVQTNDNPCKCCYITTAVCKSLGLPDDCPELESLRAFRDTVLLETSQGRRDVAFYYQTAPLIVKAIDRRADAPALYRQIYARTIRPAVAAIQGGRMHEAYEIYRDMLNSLDVFRS